MTPEQIQNLRSLLQQRDSLEQEIQAYGSQAAVMKRVIELEGHKKVVGLTGDQELEMEYLQNEVLLGVQPYKKVSYPVGPMQPVKPLSQSAMYVRASREGIENLESLIGSMRLPPDTQFRVVPMQPPKRRRVGFFATIKAAVKGWFADYKRDRLRKKQYNELTATADRLLKAARDARDAKE